MTKRLLTAEQAAHHSYVTNVAAHQAKSAGCMVELDSDTLLVYPTAPQFYAVIELPEHEYMPLDLQSRQNPKAP